MKNKMKNKVMAIVPTANDITKLFAATAVALSFSFSAVAQPVVRSESNDTEDNYISAIVYLPGGQLQQLAPQEILVSANQPVVDAVGRIVQAFRSQNIGLKGYNVTINPSTQEARINLEISDPRGAEVFDSMSSASQYDLFEAIRETLLTQPIYKIRQVNFTANGVPFDI